MLLVVVSHRAEVWLLAKGRVCHPTPPPPPSPLLTAARCVHLCPSRWRSGCHMVPLCSPPVRRPLLCRRGGCCCWSSSRRSSALLPLLSLLRLTVTVARSLQFFFLFWPEDVASLTEINIARASAESRKDIFLKKRRGAKNLPNCNTF